MNDRLDKIKEYINDVAYNVKDEFSLNLDEIIKSEFEKAFEILEELGIIKYIEEKYNMNYEKPELVILENDLSFTAEYSDFENKISFSKKSVDRKIDKQLEYLGYKEIKRSINDIKGIGYLDISYNSIFLYPFYIKDENMRKAIAKSLIRSIMFHEIWHSIDFSILRKLVEDSSIKDMDYFIILKNLELRASVFEVVMYYLANGFHKDEKGYRAVYRNIPTCREFIDKLERKEDIYTDVPYDLGFCYGNIIIAKYRSSLKENIQDIIKDIIYLNKERAIDEIRLYGDNLEWLLNDKNSDTVI
jgi:hypothetical protein